MGQTCCTKILQFYGTSNIDVMLEIVILNGQLWYYVISEMLNKHILSKKVLECPTEQTLELQKDIIAASVEWIKFVKNIIDSLIILQEQNKNDLIDSNQIN